MRAKILSASAGSGKTYRLAYKFVHDTIKHFTSKPYLYRAILAVTFTNKATEQMKSRILEEINCLATDIDKSSYLKDLQKHLGLGKDEIAKRAKIIRTRILHDYSHFMVLTIDKFFQRILRAFVKELGIEINYNIELDTTPLLSQSTDMLIDDISENEELRKWVIGYVQENIDDSDEWDISKEMKALGKDIFNEQSKQAIHDSLPRTELLRIIKETEQSLAKTQAQIMGLARQAQDLMLEAGVSTNDFIQKSKGATSAFDKIVAGKTINTASYIKYTNPDESWSKNPAAIAIAPRLRDILTQLLDIYDKDSKQQLSLQYIRQRYRSYALLQDIYNKVRLICDQEGKMLLSETKYILSKFVEQNDAPFIYEKTGNRFERFMIDEFQDTSIKEWSNFVPLLKNAMAQSEDTSVLIVGDVKQSIYRWRGGDWRILHQYAKDTLGKDDTDVEFMEDNYRSLSQVVEFNNKVIKHIVDADNKTLNTWLDTELKNNHIKKSTYEEMHDILKTAYNAHHQTPRFKGSKDGYVCVESFNEQPPLIEAIRSAIERGYSYSDILILYRSHNTDGAKATKILLDYKRENNDFNIMTQDSLIVGSAAISNFIIAIMRLSQNSNDSISLAIVNDYLGRAYNLPLCDKEQEMLIEISRLTPELAFERIVHDYKLGNHHDEIAYLQALHEQVVSFCASKVADIQLFLREWDESGYKSSLSIEKSNSTIELMTIHKAKGLERKVVIIPYCNWNLYALPGSMMWANPEQGNKLSEIGCFPINIKKDMLSTVYADEYCREYVYGHIDGINLLYVALTRAKEELYAFIPNNATGTGKLLRNAVSDSATIIDENIIRAEFGSKQSPSQSGNSQEKKRVKNVIIDSYPTTTINIDTSLRMPQQRYFEEVGTTLSSQRNLGIIMHEILNSADSAEQVKEGIEQARAAARLDSKQANNLKQIIEREFQRPEVSQWFGPWEEVRRESDIIINGSDETRRPDRVMISGGKAVVVDYKFGQQSPSHCKQIRRYMKLLNKMGYEQTEGYVWYMTLGQIVRIEN